MIRLPGQVYYDRFDQIPILACILQNNGGNSIVTRDLSAGTPDVQIWHDGVRDSTLEATAVLSLEMDGFGNPNANFSLTFSIPSSGYSAGDTIHVVVAFVDAGYIELERVEIGPVIATVPGDVGGKVLGGGTGWYVATSGNGGSDSNAGTRLAPFLTITHACSIAQPGDTIFVGPGAFVIVSGTMVPNFVTLKGSGNSTVIQYPGNFGLGGSTLEDVNLVCTTNGTVLWTGTGWSGSNPAGASLGPFTIRRVTQTFSGTNAPTDFIASGGATGINVMEDCSWVYGYDAGIPLIQAIRCVFRNIGDSGGGAMIEGIETTSAAGSVFTECEFIVTNSVGSPVCYGIYDNGCAYMRCNVYVSSTAGTPRSVSGPATMIDCNFDRNIIDATRGTLIDLQQTVLSVTGNVNGKVLGGGSEPFVGNGVVAVDDQDGNPAGTAAINNVMRNALPAESFVIAAGTGSGPAIGNYLPVGLANDTGTWKHSTASITCQWSSANNRWEITETAPTYVLLAWSTNSDATTLVDGSGGTYTATQGINTIPLATAMPSLDFDGVNFAGKAAIASVMADSTKKLPVADGNQIKGTTGEATIQTDALATGLDFTATMKSSLNAATPQDTAGTTTLLTRLSASRAGYLDNLNVGGAVASHSDIAAINQSASKHMILATVGQYAPGETYTVEMNTFNASTGLPAAADTTPTLTSTGTVSGDLSANLSGYVNPSTGVYRWTYTPGATPTLEQIRHTGSATVAGLATTLNVYTQTVDQPTATFTSTDKNNLTAIYNKLPTGNIADDSTVAKDATVSKPGTAQTITANQNVNVNQWFGGSAPTIGTSMFNSASDKVLLADTQSGTWAASVTTATGKWSGITSLANWLRAIMRKSAPDSTAIGEINDSGGTYDPTVKSLEAQAGGGGSGAVTISGVTAVIED